MLTDQFGRRITYLRLAVTDRCNLRCQYCMPAHGIDIVDRHELLSYKEMYRIVRILSELGVDKVRLTGGEPFVRKEFIHFLESLSFNDKLKEINITTNGALIADHIPALERIGIHAISAPLVVILISLSLSLKESDSRKCIKSFLTKGSPPVRRTLSTPSSLKTRTILYISL